MKKAYKKTVQTQITSTVSEETGELLDISTKKVEVLVKNKEEFFYLYSHILGVLDSITKGPALSILAVLIFKFIPGSGFFGATKYLKESIAETCGISISSVEKGMKILEETGVIKKHSRGEYSLNPNYAWKGTTTTRNEKLRLDLQITTEKEESFF